MSEHTDQPLVSCVMPTYNRRDFVPHAIRYFLRQEYANKELIIIDDGTDCISDLVPQSPHIHYYRLKRKITLGAKLNLACSYAKGKIIANWDDDDWYAARRLRYQVEALQSSPVQVCGINKLLYYDIAGKDGYQYVYPENERKWLLGSSLCYTKSLWSKNNFADIDVGMDGLFVWATPENSVLALPDHTIAVHMIHHANVSPKKTAGAWWHQYPPAELQQLMQADWNCYNNVFTPPTPIDENTIVTQPITHKPATVKNIYCCLVHENEAAVVDMVRNLRYHDPASGILLYNGGTNKDLLKGFPYEKLGVVIHPDPKPVQHGYLHNYALNTMQFALDHFSFDYLTIVDSDQLCIRSSYTTCIDNFLSTRSNVGLLSSMPKPITEAYTDTTFWPARQALKEFDLWQPLLKRFPNGEAQFVHWTFWPSTVFTVSAIKDLTRFFREDKQLQAIMQRSKIWATEEVILPTLVKLLGYEIAANPCSYDYVKYQQTFSLAEMQAAMNRTDTFWMHPVDRKYEHTLRRFSREQSNHYQINSQTSNNNPNNMLTTFSLIDKIRNIQGWLQDKEADLLMATTFKACNELHEPHSIVEIGSYQGKSTVLLGSIVKEYFSKAKVYAIDPHEGNVGAADQGIQRSLPTLEMFNRNIHDAGISRNIELIKDYSFNVQWDRPIVLLFIDGLHDYVNVAKDFWHFAEHVASGGYIAFHDYADYYPGVIAFVDELVATGNYAWIAQAESMVVIKKH